MKRVLIANIFGIGDVLNSTPLILNLKKEYKGITIDYLCNGRTKGILKNNPDIDKIFVYEKDDFIKLWQKNVYEFVKVVYSLFLGIRSRKYDAVFDLTLSRKFGLFFILAGIQERIGLNYKKRGMFLTKRVDFSGFNHAHVIEYYLELLKKIGMNDLDKNMQLIPDNAGSERISAYLKKKGNQDKRLVLLNPGGGASWGKQAYRRRWSTENFARTADIISENSINVAIIGDIFEKDICKDVSDKMKTKPVFVENNLSLCDYIALLNKCSLLLCNDGGPLHIATALDIKAVFIFGPVDEKIYGPYPASNKRRVITARDVNCRPCYKKFRLPECEYGMRCLNEITPKKTAIICLELLERGEI